MKTKLIRNLIQTCLLAALLALPAAVQAQFLYTTTNGTITITGYTGSGGAVTIPATINGLPVTSIGNEAFGGSMTSFTIPASVTNIGDRAFFDCPYLTAITIAAQNPAYSSADGVLFDKDETILIRYPGVKTGSAYTIPGSVTNIASGAFAFCTNLTSVTIPNSVTSLGLSTFIGCYNLTNVTISTNLHSIGDFAFEGTALINVTIPDSVTNIGDYAFVDCVSLTNVTIGNGVINIGDYAFGYTSLTSVTIGNSVTSIGDEAFEGTALTSVTIPGSVTNIGDAAFLNCKGLIYAFFTGDAPAVDSTVFLNFSVSGDFVHYFYRATAYYLSGTTGWSNTFAGLPTVMLNGPAQFGTTDDGLNYMSDQVGITIITGYAGSNQVVVIPSVINGLPVTGIASYAFQYNNSITSVTIPNNVTSIGRSAFAGTALTSVTIPNSVTDIESEAFDDCEGLMNVTIGNGVTSIGDYAFEYTALTSVTIGNSVTRIGDDAFGECFELTNVIIGNGVTAIGNDTFENCINLTSVTIPDSVTSIGDEAFEDCYNLTSVYFVGNAPTADSSVFFADPTAAYYLPGTLGWNDFSTNTGLYIAQWFLPNPLILNKGPGFGVQSNQFVFTISWATNVPVVVEACTNLSNPVWLPVSTNTLVGGTSYFSDPQPASLPGRFYRLRSP